jgi:hypothetical protein
MRSKRCRLTVRLPNWHEREQPSNKPTLQSDSRRSNCQAGSAPRHQPVSATYPSSPQACSRLPPISTVSFRPALSRGSLARVPAADEARTNPVHRAALTDAASRQTAVTRASTGRYARAAQPVHRRSRCPGRGRLSQRRLPHRSRARRRGQERRPTRDACGLAPPPGRRPPRRPLPSWQSCCRSRTEPPNTGRHSATNSPQHASTISNGAEYV